MRTFEGAKLPTRILCFADFSENLAEAGDRALEYSSVILKVGLASLGTVGSGSASMLSLGSRFRRDLDLTFGAVAV